MALERASSSSMLTASADSSAGPRASSLASRNCAVDIRANAERSNPLTSPLACQQNAKFSGNLQPKSLRRRLNASSNSPREFQPKSLLTSALVSASSGCWAEGVPPAVVGVLSQLPYSSDRSAPLAERAEGALVIGDSPALSAGTSLFAVGTFGQRRAQIGIRTIP